MTEIARLVSAITTSPQQEQKVVSWIRKAGFYGSLAGLGAYLDHIERMLPALTRVVQLAPRLAPFAEELCWGLTLKPSLDWVLTSPDGDRLRVGSHIGTVEGVTAAASSGEPESAVPHHFGVVGNRSLLLHATAVLLDFAWRGHREQLRRYRHTWGLIQLLRRNEPWSALFPDPADGRPTESWVNSPPDPMHLGPDLPLDLLDTDETVALLAVGIERRRAAHMTVRSGQLWKAVDPWAKLGKLLKATELSPTGGPHLVGESTVAADTLASLRAGQAQVAPERKSDRRWGDGASADRDTRELLLDHHHALRGRELQPLRALASRAELIHLREPDSHEQLVDAAAGYATSIALATGQIPECALHTRVVHQRALPEALRDLAEHEGLLVITESADGGQVTRWLPPGQGADFEGFPLASPPEWPAQALDFRVHELLPVPVDVLLPLVEERIGKALDRPAATARFRIKHALAQRLYAANQCEATIRIVCGPGTTGVDPESLHHYIDPRSPGVSNAYARAQQRLFATEQWPVEPNPVTDEEAFIVVPLDHMQRVLQYMREQIDDDEVKDPKVRHNRIAIYVATLFVICTGHRQQKHLLHFWWQVCIEALIAFLSDKQVVGAEARFVGLPQSFVDQYTLYLKHIQWLLEKLDRSDRAAARQVRIACGLIDDTEPRGQNAAGFLFRFWGDRLVPISTDSVARAIREAEKSLGIESPTPITARVLRRNVATFCSAVGGLGVAIERFLGHGGSRHPLGSGSAVCHLDAIDEFRPVLDRFYRALQAGAVCPPWLKPDAKSLALPRPAPRLSDEAFEGRSLESGQDRALAVQAIRSEISLEQLEDRGELELDDEAVANIRSRIQARLAYEPGAQAKVYEALAAELQKMAQSGRLIVSAASVNLVVTTPGPVPVVCGRHHAIGTAIKKQLPQLLSTVLSAEADSIERRLALLAVCLVIFDAVVNPRDLEALVGEAQADGVTVFDLTQTLPGETQIRLRAQVEGRKRFYDRTCDLTDPSALALIGYLKGRPTGDRTPVEWRVVRREADRLIAAALKDPQFTFSTLIDVMCAYWLLRQPGFVYASAVGELESNAESEVSTEDLLGIRPSAAPRDATDATKLDERCPLEQALEAVRAFLRSARGKKQERTGSSRRQRRELRKAFRRELPKELLGWMSQQPVIELWMSVVHHMLMEGGLRTDRYAFSSIQTYQSRVLEKFVEVGWDLNVAAMSGEERGNFFRSVLDRLSPELKDAARTVLKVIDMYLVTVVMVEPCEMFPYAGRIKSRSRNVLLSETSVAAAIKCALFRNSPRTDMDRARAAYIGLLDAFRLRSAEAYGLLHDDLVFGGDSVLAAVVRPNTVRSIKSTRRVRFVRYAPSGQSVTDAVSRQCAQVARAAR